MARNRPPPAPTNRQKIGTMTSIALPQNKLSEPDDKCPASWDAELVFLWRRYSAGGMYQE
jgi:hypothetical protein